MGKFIDLTGQRFGRLTVLSRTEDYISPKGRHIIRWLCKCDCGAITSVTGQNLTKKNGSTKSCGCLTGKSKIEEDLVGMQFTYLTVKKKIDGIGKKYLCHCKCGKDVIVKACYLKSGETKSCGCYSRDRISKTMIDIHSKKYNNYELYDDYAIIKTSQNKNIMIDVNDVERCKRIRWQVDVSTMYVRGWDYNVSPPKKYYLHRFLLNVEDGNIVVDHINGNRLDNRKNNLRTCTQAENSRNSNKKTNGYPGVTYYGWVAKITINGKTINLGSFDTEEEAIQARIEAENKYHGEFGYYNSRIKNKEESA